MVRLSRVILRFVRLSRTPGRWGAGQGYRDVQRLPRNRFRLLCAELFRRLGFCAKTTTYTEISSVNIIAVKHYITYFIQCRQAGPSEVDLTEISGFFNALRASGCSRGIFVSTGLFSGQAQAFAADKPIELINGRRLNEYLVRLEIAVDSPDTGRAENPLQPEAGRLNVSRALDPERESRRHR
jgi:restriction system protein